MSVITKIKNDAILGAIGKADLQPLNYVPRIVVFGDSYGHYENWDLSGTDSRCAMDSGLWHVLFALVGYHRFRIVKYAGVGGNTAAMMRARYATDVQPYAHDILLGNAGVNDFYGYDRSVDDVLTDVQAIITRELAKGAIVLWASCPTQLTVRSNYTLAKQKKAIEYNRRLAAWAQSKRGLSIVDASRPIMNMSDTTNAAPRTDTMWSSDGIHLHFNGAYRIAKDNFDILDRILPRNVRQFTPLDSVGDAWSGQMLPAGGGQMAGTTGIAGAGVTGPVPAGWTARRTASGTTATAVAAKVADKGGDWLELTINGNGASSLEQFEILTSSFHAQLAAGNTMNVSAEIQVDISGGLQVQQLYLRGYLYNGATIIYSDWNRVGGGSITYVMDGNESLAPCTPTVTLPPGYAPTAAQVYFNVHVKGNGTAVIRIRNVLARKNPIA